MVTVRRRRSVTDRPVLGDSCDHKGCQSTTVNQGLRAGPTDRTWFHNISSAVLDFDDDGAVSVVTNRVFSILQ